jgi:hypothetical protein
LLVRQFTAESSQGYAVWVRTDAALWPRAEQFEVLVSFAATLVEDLFRGGQLQTLALDGEAPVVVRHVRDLESWLDRLAVAEFKAEGSERGGATPTTGTAVASGRNVLTFAPEGGLGVAALINGQRLAAT